MSSIYVLEPPTKGKVVVKTSMGPLDIELWPKEAPKAVRNFVQLCLEGYYDNTIFHRIIKSFLVQAGDPTGSGTGGESIYGSVFADEFHSRLKFNHRGIVACANAGSPHSNGSQFFLTLDRCDWLDRKNTIFGKVTGDSIYNLLRIGDVETDKNDRPLDITPRIISTEVLWNPFDDIIPREVHEKPLPHSLSDAQDKAQKHKVGKKLNLLSFGEEVEEDEKELASVNVKIKSSHDVLDDARLLKDETLGKETSSAKSQKEKDVHTSVREALNSKKDVSVKDPQKDLSRSPNRDIDDDEADFDARMRDQILQKRKTLGDVSSRQKLAPEKRPQKEVHKVSSPRHDVEDETHVSGVEKLSLKKKGVGSEARAERLATANVDLQLLNRGEQERQLHKQKKRRLLGRAEDTLAKLERFKNSLSKKLGASASTDSDKGDEEDDDGWKKSSLKFEPDPSKKDGMARRDDPGDYVVKDPLLEKGKEKFNKMEAKFKRRNREWAGKSLT
ncbi:Peptidyl-prolyl cis-trans isomerase-like 2 [Acorus calamus]|uniref:Peptidyl-prolyl cis-trans isomerase-like 2 n=1 Tax=Acorus calamus TaxID=4465 RepID=A0AAV9EKG5_ACOCL|nr:Peptidyl-prolyl cis-trans isomerase-like 2 [Acorus calamus]